MLRVLCRTRFLPARNLACVHGYVRNYVARLCREGRVTGRPLGRISYVNADSFAAFGRRNDNSAALEPAHSMV